MVRPSWRLRGLQIDHQLVLGRSLHRQIGGLLAPQYPVDIGCAAPIAFAAVGAVGNEPAGGNVVTVPVDIVVGELDAGAAYTDQALVLNPNFAVGWMLSGLVSVYRGEPDVAIGRLARAVRLSPLDPFTFVAQTAYAMAHFFAGRLDEALSWSEQVLRDHPDYQLALRIFASASALTGRQEEAQRAVERLCRLDPALRISNLGDRYPLRRSEYFIRWAEGLRRAGLRE
jgi:tetratricopeptide (TPR) repeat protein